MKVPPKRKGNAAIKAAKRVALNALNESPSEKEGKCIPRKTLILGLIIPQ